MKRERCTDLAIPKCISVRDMLNQDHITVMEGRLHTVAIDLIYPVCMVQKWRIVEVDGFCFCCRTSFQC